jgi:hypothetical protein
MHRAGALGKSVGVIAAAAMLDAHRRTQHLLPVSLVPLRMHMVMCNVPYRLLLLLVVAPSLPLPLPLMVRLLFALVLGIGIGNDSPCRPWLLLLRLLVCSPRGDRSNVNRLRRVAPQLAVAAPDTAAGASADTAAAAAVAAAVEPQGSCGCLLLSGSSTPRRNVVALHACDDGPPRSLRSIHSCSIVHRVSVVG